MHMESTNVQHKLNPWWSQVFLYFIFFWSIEPADQNSFCVFSFLRLALCIAKFTVLFRWVLYTVMCIAHFCKSWRSSLWHEWCRFCNYFKARSCLNSSKLISFDMWHSLLVRSLKLGFDNNWGKSFEWKYTNYFKYEIIVIYHNGNSMKSPLST